MRTFSLVAKNSLLKFPNRSGISSSRLELLEDRLKSDSLSEVNTFDGRILLHTELEDGSVAPIWETIESPTNVKTLREIMDDVVKTTDVDLSYYRIPITAEKAPDFSDIREIVEIVSQLDVENSAIIVNCQLGMSPLPLFVGTRTDRLRQVEDEVRVP